MQEHVKVSFSLLYIYILIMWSHLCVCLNTRFVLVLIKQIHHILKKCIFIDFSRQKQFVFNFYWIHFNKHRGKCSCICHMCRKQSQRRALQQYFSWIASYFSPSCLHVRFSVDRLFHTRLLKIFNTDNNFSNFHSSHFPLIHSLFAFCKAIPLWFIWYGIIQTFFLTKTKNLALIF